LELLQRRLIQDGIVSGIAPETVRLLLKKNKLKPWLVKSWCIPEVTAEFLRKMEHILGLYALPDDLSHPLVCFDEKSIQLLAQTRAVMGCKPGKATRQDHEYKRNGTRNLFMLVAPKRGERAVFVTNHRTKIDFAQVMRYVVDVMYPEAEYINLVMDNLNTHHYHSLVEAFGKQEADRIMSRLRFHFTPTHASWLNMAEVELSVLSGQCLSRRIADDWALRFEIASWENARNERKAQICWKFTTDDARKVFKQYYSTSLES